MNISKQFPQFWSDTKSEECLPSGHSNYSLDLPFTFPFYSSSVRRVEVVPGGRLSLSGGYIAPLSAHLDPHHDSLTSSLCYWISHKDTSLTLQWRNAVVSDIPLRAPFTFRLRIWASGLIEFLYNKLGIDLEHLLVLDDNVKIGIWDGQTGDSLWVSRKAVKERTMITINPVSAAVPPPTEDISLVTPSSP